MTRIVGLFMMAVSGLMVFMSIMTLVMLIWISLDQTAPPDNYFWYGGLLCVVAPLVLAIPLVLFGYRIVVSAPPLGEVLGQQGTVAGYRLDGPESRQHKGRAYQVEYVAPAHKRPSLLTIRVEAHSPAELQFHAMTWFDQMCKWLGIAREHLTRDKHFDEQVYVRGPLNRFTHEYLDDSRRRQAILELRRLGFVKVQLTGQHVEAVWPLFDPSTHGTPDLDERAAECLFQLADRIPDYNEHRGGTPTDVSLLWTIFLWLVIVPYAGLFFLAFRYPPLNVLPLIQYAALTFLVVYLVFGWVAAWLIRGHSTSHDRWAALMGFGLLFVALGTAGAVAGYNALADQEEPVERDLLVVRKHVTSGRSPSYTVFVPAWDGSGGTVSLSVNAKEYNTIVPNLDIRKNRRTITG